MAKKTRWKLLRKLPGGHRVFLDLESKRMSIADQSGTFPEQTDDGTLWLDHKKIISVGEDRCALDVIAASDGQSYSVWITPQDALVLGQLIGFTLKCSKSGLRFRLERAR